MKVLVACEYSGRVREAFATQGHEVLSCDLLPTEQPGNHYQGDVRDVLYEPWDLIIAHPPCTYLSNAGLHYLKTRPGRMAQLQEAFDLVKLIYSSPCPKVCIENPIGWLNTNWKKPDQIIQPYQFGEPEMKKTCLWLKGLDLLVPTNDIGKPEPTGFCIKGNGRRYNYYFHQARSAKERSRTFQGIADAMAEQWSNRPAGGLGQGMCQMCWEQHCGDTYWDQHNAMVQAEQERFEQEVAQHFIAENLGESAFLKDRFGEYAHPQINWGWHCWLAALASRTAVERRMKVLDEGSE